jgi:LPXTG-motif cell wall-anchored protein
VVNTGNSPVDGGSNNTSVIALGAVALLGLGFVGARRVALVQS